MASLRLQTLVCALLVCTSTESVAEEELEKLESEKEDSLEMAFLEYLGMWEESDEDWLLLNDDVVADNEEGTEPLPEGKESPERKDES